MHGFISHPFHMMFLHIMYQQVIGELGWCIMCCDVTCRVMSYHVMFMVHDVMRPSYDNIHYPRPANHFSALADLTSTLITDTSHDYMYYVDPTVRWTTNITHSMIMGELIGMEHPYYRRHGVNFCTKVDHPEVGHHGHDDITCSVV